MISGISLIQSNLRLSIAASRDYARAVFVKSRNGSDTGTVVLRGPYCEPEYCRLHCAVREWNK